DAAVGVDHGVVGSVESLAGEVVGQDGGLAVVLVADDAAMAVLARDLPSFAIEGVAVGVAGGLAHDADVAGVFQPAELDVVGDVRPDEVLADSVPGGSLGPEHAGVEAPDGRVADLDLVEPRIEDDDVGIGVADGFGVGSVTPWRRRAAGGLLGCGGGAGGPRPRAGRGGGGWGGPPPPGGFPAGWPPLGAHWAAGLVPLGCSPPSSRVGPGAPPG